MNVLVVDQFSELGGAQQCLVDLVRGFLERGWQVSVGLPGAGPLADRLRDLNVRVEFLPLPLYSAGHKTLGDVLRFVTGAGRLRSAIADLVRRCSADVLYVNGPRLLPSVTVNVPVVFHAHSHVTTKYSQLLVARGLSRNRALVVASSRSVVDGLGVDSSRVVYNGTADQGFRRRVFPPVGDWVVAHVGRIAPGKGQLEFVRAARLLAGQRIRFRVCGAPMFADGGYAAQVRREALPNVEFVDWSDGVADILHQADLLAVPSLFPESTTRVILEAFSAGTPVVAFPVGGIPEVIEHGVSGFLTAATTPEALAAGIEEAMRGSDTLSTISDAARQKWESLYTLERYQHEIADIVECAAKGSEARHYRAANS